MYMYIYIYIYTYICIYIYTHTHTFLERFWRGWCQDWIPQTAGGKHAIHNKNSYWFVCEITTCHDVLYVHVTFNPFCCCNLTFGSRTGVKGILSALLVLEVTCSTFHTWAVCEGFIWLTASYGSVSVVPYLVRFGFEPPHPHLAATCVVNSESLCWYRVDSPWIPWLVHKCGPSLPIAFLL